MVKAVKTAARIFGALIALVAVAAAYLPPVPARMESPSERYLCFWEDGTKSECSFSEAYSALAGIGEEGILLSEGTRRGVVRSASCLQAAEVLSCGEFAELLTLDLAGSSPLVRAALVRVYGNRGYYLEEPFCFDGARVFRTKRKAFEELVLFSKISSDELIRSGAKKIVVRAEFSARSLVGSEAEELSAFPPYYVQDGALYLETAGGDRLVAALPLVSDLTVADVSFLDEGALAPCRAIERLSLPLLPSAGESGFGRLADLFQEEIPPSLRVVKVRGGKVGSFAFYGADLEQIDLCGIPAEDVSPQAFVGCNTALLHTRRLLDLSGYHHTVAPCGCYLYTR